MDRNMEIMNLCVDNQNQVLSFSTKNQKIYLYNLQKRFFFDRLGSTYYNIHFLAFSSQARSLISVGNQGVVQMWELFRQKQLVQFSQHSKSPPIRHLTLSLDNLITLSASSMNIWSLEERHIVKKVVEDFSNVQIMETSPEGNLLLL